MSENQSTPPSQASGGGPPYYGSRANSGQQSMMPSSGGQMMMPSMGMQPSSQMGQMGQTSQMPQMPQMSPMMMPMGGQQQQQDLAVPGQLPIEQSYIENILRMNKGKVATIYQTFEGSDKWNSKVFRGVIEAAGRDHIILSDPQTGKRYVLLMVFVNYISFDEKINYSPDYQGPPMTTYSPR
ncbi:spore coat protein gerQ [Fictibacillus macauensis ZFHKF-1]|uniref:Spore coat protein gerQ n=1 Tax=Fictibacillus macauensis ZFHKF-1 TaxID=1196324 RepID=I8U9R3_9BACL|nr:spore coat protein GerQ [Fictibacillus macauensis]EIT83695.1 spore coat protein gerQ [Fictibacillus macauensis ZFHKF-1]